MWLEEGVSKAQTWRIRILAGGMSLVSSGNRKRLWWQEGWEVRSFPLSGVSAIATWKRGKQRLLTEAGAHMGDA